MQTAIQKLQAGSIELSDLERAILEESQADDAAFDFVAQRIKMPSGGGLFFTLDDEPIKSFTAVVALSQKARAWWPGEGTGQPPLCSSPDGAHGWLPAEPPVSQLKEADALSVSHPGLRGEPIENGPYECRLCPLAQFGSAPKSKGGRGQACKSLRRLVLLVDGYTMPVLFTLPPTSIKAWDRYCSGLQNRRSAYFAVKTKFSLDKMSNAAGIEYAVVNVAVADAIDEPATFAAVREIRNEYRALIGDLPIEAVEYEVTESEPF